MAQQTPDTPTAGVGEGRYPVPGQVSQPQQPQQNAARPPEPPQPSVPGVQPVTRLAGIGGASSQPKPPSPSNGLTPASGGLNEASAGGLWHIASL